MWSGELRRWGMGSLSGTYDLGVHELAEFGTEFTFSCAPGIIHLEALPRLPQGQSHLVQRIDIVAFTRADMYPVGLADGELNISDLLLMQQLLTVSNQINSRQPCRAS